MSWTLVLGCEPIWYGCSTDADPNCHLPGQPWGTLIPVVTYGPLVYVPQWAWVDVYVDADDSPETSDIIMLNPKDPADCHSYNLGDVDHLVIRLMPVGWSPVTLDTNGFVLEGGTP